MDPLELLGGIGITVIIATCVVVIFLCIFTIIGIAKCFKKAGKPGIAAWIPIWNSWVFCDIAFGHGAWMFLFLIPVFTLPLTYFLYRDFCKAYGKGLFMSLLATCLPFIIFPIMGFGSGTEYIGNESAEEAY